MDHSNHEALYSSVSRHLLLRQHSQALSTLTTLLSHHTPSESTRSIPFSTYNADAGVLEIWASFQESTIKVLKLVVTVYVSIYIAVNKGDEGKGSSLPEETKDWTKSPEDLLGHLLDLMTGKLVDHKDKALKFKQFTSVPSRWIILLPPSLMSTLILGMIKLDSTLYPSGPGENSTSEVMEKMRDVMDGWIGSLPDEAIHKWRQVRKESKSNSSSSQNRDERESLSPGPDSDENKIDLGDSVVSLSSSTNSAASDHHRSPDPSSTTSSSDSKPNLTRTRSGITIPLPPLTSSSSPSPLLPSAVSNSTYLVHLQSYIRLLELYTLELLPRCREYETAVEFIKGDVGLLGAKRKEGWLRRIGELREREKEREGTIQRLATEKDKGKKAGGEDDAAKGKSRGGGKDEEGSVTGTEETERTIRPMQKMSGVGIAKSMGKTCAKEVKESGSPGDDIEKTTDESGGYQIPDNAASSSNRSGSQSSPTPSSNNSVSRLPYKAFASLRSHISNFLDRDIETLPIPSSDSLATAAGYPFATLHRMYASMKNQVGLEHVLSVGLVFVAILMLGIRRMLSRQRSGEGGLPNWAKALVMRLAFMRVDARDMFWMVFRKVKDTFVMGTTITYV